MIARATHVYGWGLAVALAGLVAGPAAAELFRCQGPDGHTTYTDQKANCPGAKPFEPSAVVHSAPTPARPKEVAPADAAEPNPAEARHSPHTEEADPAMAQHWQDKKRAVLDQIGKIQARREWMQKYVNHCRWRDYVATRDDAGIEQVVNCSEMRQEFAALDEQDAAARKYLDDDLPEECRKAGCLPGWIR